jgi:Replicative DNA helicase
VATGLFQLDQLLGGLHRSDLIILAGRPSMGKSSLATNIGFNAAKAYREEHGEDGRPKWPTAPWSASSPWKCRPSSSPPA